MEPGRVPGDASLALVLHDGSAHDLGIDLESNGWSVVTNGEDTDLAPPGSDTNLFGSVHRKARHMAAMVATATEYQDRDRDADEVAVWIEGTVREIVLNHTAAGRPWARFHLHTATAEVVACIAFPNTWAAAASLRIASGSHVRALGQVNVEPTEPAARRVIIHEFSTEAGE
jgi:hypothetical protein